MASTPMTGIFDEAPAGLSPSILLAMLPGAHMKAQDFRVEGMIDILRGRDYPIDVLVLDTGMDDYLDYGIAKRLHDGIAPTLAALPRRKLWLLGISLGALGALLYARAHPQTVEGLILLSPFIGTRGQIAEIASAGGLSAWAFSAREPSPERDLLAWLAQYTPEDKNYPEMLLAYGTEDRFARAHRLVADLLPEDRVVAVPGGHDWESWRVLWERLLGMTPLATRFGGGR